MNDDLHRAELLSVPVTLIVLLFAFGALVAAIVPVILALTAVVATFGLLGPLSQAFPVQDSVKTVILLLGMLLGEWNWYLPRMLERLPRAGIEAPSARDPL